MSITDPVFTDVDIPQGQFIGWGRLGQKVTVRVITYDAAGGTDFNDNACPEIVGELTGPADNYKDKGATHETIAGGELVTVTCGIANLKRGVLAAAPTTGDIVQMEYTADYATAKGSGKTIAVRIARQDAPLVAVPVAGADPF